MSLITILGHFKQRINDPDIAVLAVNDTSRAIRSTWRALKLFEDLSSSDVKLYLAVSDRTVDIKSSDRRFSLILQAMFDESYALDASRRAKDSINYRKKKGTTVGQPPFGTVRNKDGYLIASPDGAWQLPTGGGKRAGRSCSDRARLWRVRG